MTTDVDVWIEQAPEETVGWATFSPTGRYRYTLGRRWGEGPKLIWLMLNPSTADAEVVDATIRRCIGFTKREGHGALEVLNLYAMRATNPKALLRAEDPEGPGNREAWTKVLDGPGVGPVVAAWGSYPWNHPLPSSEAAGARSAHHWLCLGITKGGAPRHPLYLPASAPLVPWLDTWTASYRKTTKDGGE